jgi:SPFH domain / Band 7 family
MIITYLLAMFIALYVLIIIASFSLGEDLAEKLGGIAGSPAIIISYCAILTLVSALLTIWSKTSPSDWHIVSFALQLVWLALTFLRPNAILDATESGVIIAFGYIVGLAKGGPNFLPPILGRVLNFPRVGQLRFSKVPSTNGGDLEIWCELDPVQHMGSTDPDEEDPTKVAQAATPIITFPIIVDDPKLLASIVDSLPDAVTLLCEHIDRIYRDKLGTNDVAWVLANFRQLGDDMKTDVASALNELGLALDPRHPEVSISGLTLSKHVEEVQQARLKKAGEVASARQRIAINESENLITVAASVAKLTAAKNHAEAEAAAHVVPIKALKDTGLADAQSALNALIALTVADQTKKTILEITGLENVTVMGNTLDAFLTGNAPKVSPTTPTTTPTPTTRP